jgi:hypothetical protein
MPFIAYHDTADMNQNICSLQMNTLMTSAFKIRNQASLEGVTFRPSDTTEEQRCRMLFED